MKHTLKYRIKRLLDMPVHRLSGCTVAAACLSALLLAAGGCEGGEVAPPPAPVEVSLAVKGLSGSSEASLSYRLLVFDSHDACVKNLSFVPGASSVSLDAGTYRFAALSVPEGLELPVAGTVEGMKPELAVGFGTAPVREFRISPLAEVEVGEPSTVYKASLVPAPAVLSLHLSGLPSDKTVTFKLSRMYTSVGLDGQTYSGEAAYPLNPRGETVCFPCNGEVELTYTVDGDAPQTLRTGCVLEAGSRLSVHLAWSENVRVFVLLSSIVTDWTPGNGDGETGDAE